MTTKNTRIPQIQKYKNINEKLKKIPFNKLSIESGLKQRKSKKITGKTILISFFLMAMQGKNSFQQWAEQLGNLTGKNISKQGVWKRVTTRLTKFLVLILFEALHQQTKAIQTQSEKYTWHKNYKRVLLQDSTIIALPDWLNWCFPGSVSRGEKRAQLKIQVVYDILANHFVHFEISPYTANDQSKSKDILSIATSEDLVIRDLGYFALESFNEMKKANISFISRLRYRVGIYKQTGEELNLLKELKNKREFDQWVIIGKEKQVKVRLVAKKLPPGQVANRIRKAKANRDKRLNYKKEYYQLLGYNIFITNQPNELLSINQVVQLYQLRWRIETIFKCWKSNFHLQKLIPKNCSLNKERVEAIIYMMLIFILLFQVHIYNAAVLAAEKTKNHDVSLLKICKYIANNIQYLFENNLEQMMPQILYYCRYDLRNDRQNFIQKMKLS